MPRASIGVFACLIVAVLACFLGGCGEAGGLGEVRVEQREWTSPVRTKGVQLLTDHYDIRTTVKDTLLCEYLPTFMEVCHAEYRKLMPAPEWAPVATASGVGQVQPATDQNEARPAAAQPFTRGGDRLVAYVFGGRPEWAAFTEGFVPAQAQTYLHIHAGGYMDYPTATAVMFDLGRNRTLSLMAHEGFHQYVARHFPRPVPAWLNEGLATQFEDFDLDGPRPTFRPARNLMRKNSLREALTVDNGLVPLPRLLAMDAGDAVTQSGQPTRAYYAQVWATVLFLREGPKYRGGFAHLLADAGTDRLRESVAAYRSAAPAAAGMSDGEVTFRHYITEDIEDFASECRVFSKDLVH